MVERCVWRRAGAGVSVCLVLAVLAGCGGGGGGAIELPPPDGGSASPTGLVPEAPALGETLYDDATRLLPLQAGAQWYYRGRSPAQPAYGVLVDHAAAGAGVVASRTSGMADDDTERTLRVSGGSIVADEVLAFDAASPIETVRYTLLRSPVRTGDQLVLYDRARIDSRVDLDGDGRSDTVDVAAYARVVGVASVALPDLQRSVRALRVDTVYRLRVPALGTQVASFTESQWFADGIGLVRRRVVDQADASVQAEETLVYWDGGDRGIGAMPGNPLVVGGAPVSGRPWSAVAAGGRVMVATTLPGQASPDHATSFVLSALDARGNVLASRQVDDVALGFRPGALLPLGDAVGLLNLEPRPGVAGQGTVRVRLLRYGTDGRTIGDPAGIELADGVLPQAHEAASDGQRLWLLWADVDPANGRHRLWLRTFEVDGRPTGAATPLGEDTPVVVTEAFSHLGLGVSGERVVASWSTYDAPQAQSRFHHAVAVGGDAPVVAEFATSHRFAYSLDPRPVPVVTAGAQAMAWVGNRMFDPATTDTGSDQLLRAVQVADDASLRPATAGSLDDEVLDAGSEGLYEGLLLADGERFTAAILRNERMVPDEPGTDGWFIELLGWDGRSPLAGTAPDRLRFFWDRHSFGPSGGFGHLHALVPLADRWLALTWTDDGTVARVIFRP